MAKGYGYGQSGFSSRAATPPPPKPPTAKQYTIPAAYTPSTYAGGGPVTGNLNYVLGVLNPGKSTSTWGYNAPPGSGFDYNTYVGGQQAPPPSSGPSFDPNAWKSDPGYLMALAAQQQGDTQLDAWLKQGRTSQLIDFGDPNMSISGFNLDPATKAMIQQNTASGNSQLARLDQNHALGLKSVINTLAGRGLLNSGETGYQQSQQDQLYGHNVYDARNALLSHLSDQYQSYLQQRNQYQQSVAQAAQAAYANYAAQAANYGY